MNEQTDNKTAKTLAFSLIALCLVAILLGIYNVTVNRANKSAGIEAHNIGGDKLAYITLDGMIMEGVDQSSIWDQESSAVIARRLLYTAAEDENVKGVLLRINSPGGTVGMSQELYQAVTAVREEKPIVVSMGDVAASGGYYTAAAANKIVANPGTLTASIGVIISTLNVEELLNNKLGVKDVTVKSGQYKDLLSPYRPTSASELKLVQNIIDLTYEQFFNAVVEGRTQGIKDPKKKEEMAAKIRAVADGRVVTGTQALEAGLVDKLGGLEDAKVLLQEMAGEKFEIKNPTKLPLEHYEEPFSFWDSFAKGPRFNIRLSQSVPVEGMAYDIMLRQRFSNQPLWLMRGF